INPQYLDLKVLPDGKVLAIGRHPTNDTTWRVVRLNADGSLDASFGTAGIAETIFASVATPDEIILHDDGRITVLGNAPSTSSGWALARYHSDGTPDTSFGGSGSVLLP